MDSHATTLAAALGVTSGTNLMNLGVYTDSDGIPGTLLPGGQGSTTDIPGVDECCGLAEVTLPDPGVAMLAGVQYWLVVSTNDIQAPDFSGIWKNSSNNVSAVNEPEIGMGWASMSGGWVAAKIRGTSP